MSKVGGEEWVRVKNERSDIVTRVGRSTPKRKCDYRGVNLQDCTRKASSDQRGCGREKTQKECKVRIH